MSRKERVITFAKDHLLMIFISLLLSAGFILLFSPSTSPLSYYYNGVESAKAVTIAKAWHFDILPYRDMFAELGPYVYWLGSIGVGIANGNKVGIIAPQMLSLWIFFLSVYALSRRDVRNHFYSASVLLLTFVILRISYPDGMHGAEWILPYAGWSMYFIDEYLRSGHMHFSSRKAGLIGISAGVASMSLPETFVPLLIPSLSIPVLLLFRKQWKESLMVLLSYMAGALLVILPFVYYFHSKDILDLMIYDVFTHRSVISDSTVLWFPEATLYAWQRFFATSFAVWCLLPAAILNLLAKRKAQGIVQILSALLSFYVMTRMSLSAEHALPYAIHIVLFCNALVSLIRLKKEAIVTTVLSICLTVGCASYFAIRQLPAATSMLAGYTEYPSQGWEVLTDQLPSEDYDKLVFYGGSLMNRTYLLTNAMPCYPYFAEQDELAARDPNLKEKIHAVFSTKKAKWIITDSHTREIEEILESDYSLYADAGLYKMYLRKES